MFLSALSVFHHSRARATLALPDQQSPYCTYIHSEHQPYKSLYITININHTIKIHQQLLTNQNQAVNSTSLLCSARLNYITPSSTYSYAELFSPPSLFHPSFNLVFFAPHLYILYMELVKLSNASSSFQCGIL